jgi:hypothetical protein
MKTYGEVVLYLHFFNFRLLNSPRALPSRVIYTDVSNGLFTEMFTVDHILPLFLSIWKFCLI